VNNPRGAFSQGNGMRIIPMRRIVHAAPVIAMAVTLMMFFASRGALAQHGGAESPPGHGASASGGEGGHGAESQSPLPDPTDPATWWSAFWVVIIFIVLIAVLYPTAWKNVLAGLKAREQRIRADIADAEAARKKAEATLQEYNTQLASAEARIRDMLAKATTDGEKLATTIRMQAQTEAEEIKERAQKDIDAAKNAAIGEIYAQAAELSTGIAEKILRRNLNADDQRDLVRSSIEQMKGVNAN